MDVLDRLLHAYIVSVTEVLRLLIERKICLTLADIAKNWDRDCLVQIVVV